MTLSVRVGALERDLLNSRGDAIRPAHFKKYLASLQRTTRRDPLKAESASSRAMLVARAVGDGVALAHLQRARAHARRASNRWPEAASDYRAALKRFQDLDRADECAFTRIGLIDALMYLGRYEDALFEAHAARRTVQRLGDPIRGARIENNIGNIHHRRDDLETAIQWYDRARRTFRRRHDDSALALVEFNRGNVLGPMGRTAEARIAYETAGAIFSRQGFTDRTAQVRYNLAYLRFLENRLPEALEELEQVRVTFQATGDERHLGLTRLDESEILLRLNLWDDAGEAATEAIRRLKALGLDYERAKALTFLALATARRGDPSEAAGLLDSARELFKTEKNRWWVGETSLQLARLAVGRGAWSEARLEAQRARRTFARRISNEALGRALLIEAEAARGAGRRAQAGRTLEAALQAARRSRSPWLTAEVRELAGLLALDRGDAATARRHFNQAIKAIEQLRALLSGDDLRAGFLRERDRPYLELARLELVAGRPRQAFELFERGRARALLDLLTDMPAGKRAPGKGRRKLETRARHLLSELGRRYHEDDVAESSGQRQWTSAGISEARESLEAEAARLLRRVDQSPGSIAGRRPGLGEVQRLLRPGETLLSFHEIGGRVGVFRITRTRFDSVPDLAGAADIERLAESLRFQWGRFRFDAELLARHGAQLESMARSDLRRLHELLISPFDSPSEKGPLIIVPTAGLRSVPFSALDDGTACLARRRAIVVSPSAAVWSRCRTHETGDGGLERAVLIGIPDKRAPQVADEIRELAGRLPGARVFLGSEATAHQFLASLPKASILHVATHGMFRTDRPNLSGVRLSDRWVYGYEVARGMMRARLVVLSACVTGLSAAWAGGDWMGLARSFLTAGARRVLVGLWDVDDDATRQLMGHFYRFLINEGHLPAEALARAQAEMASSGWHPYYWSGFSLMGDL
ncbi:MAG: CHAT domain-containing protein [Candidatus Eisenbacteria bacterium]|nr:CHAT domain-containing protein [Candidatus Eisenbacteria bacterium]